MTYDKISITKTKNYINRIKIKLLLTQHKVASDKYNLLTYKRATIFRSKTFLLRLYFKLIITYNYFECSTKNGWTLVKQFLVDL